MELESQNITDITMSQLSQLAPVCEGDILSNALQQTILGQQEDSSSSYSANSPFSPDSHNGELEPPLTSSQSENNKSVVRAGCSPVSSPVQD